MKVRIVNTMTSGGAAKAALRLHAQLRTRGIESVYVTRDLNDPKRCIEKAKLKPRWIGNRLATRVAGWASPSLGYQPHGLSDTRTIPECELFSDCRSDYGVRATETLFDCDLINLHWVSKFIDLPSLLATFAGNTPIVWTLHDMNAITGGCHYDAGCQKFLTSCGHCPQLHKPSASDASAQIFRSKRRSLSQLKPEQLRIVTPSRWLLEQARRSPVFSPFCDSVIPNGFDLDTFRPMDKVAARQFLGISEDSRLLLFLADNLNNPRKGLDLLSRAFSELQGCIPKLHLLIVGYGDLTDFNILSVPKTVLGQIGLESMLAGIYSAADLFLLPSRQDNLPNTAIESIACGTPVVAYSVGGIPEIVRPGLTGWLADQVDAKSLARSIVDALNQLEDPQIAMRMRASCRLAAEADYRLELQAERYIKLYENAIELCRR